ETGPDVSGSPATTPPTVGPKRRPIRETQTIRTGVRTSLTARSVTPGDGATSAADDPDAAVVVGGALAGVGRPCADQRVRARPRVVVAALRHDDDVPPLRGVELENDAHPRERALEERGVAVDEAGRRVRVAERGHDVGLLPRPLRALRLLARVR